MLPRKGDPFPGETNMMPKEGQPSNQEALDAAAQQGACCMGQDPACKNGDKLVLSLNLVPDLSKPVSYMDVKKQLLEQAAAAIEEFVNKHVHLQPINDG